MSVNDEIHAGHFGQQVNGAVAVCSGFGVHTEVAQTDDEVHTLCLQVIHSTLSGLIQVFKGSEGDFLDHAGVDLGGGFRGFQTEETELHAALGGDDGGAGQDGLAGFVSNHVAADRGELGLGEVLHQLSITEVEFMVAQGDQVITCGVHHFDCGSALGSAHIGGALAEVAGIDSDHFSTMILEPGAQGGDIGIALESAVHVIGVKNDGGAGIVGAQVACENFRCGSIVSIGHVCRSGHAYCKDHDEGEDQTQKPFHKTFLLMMLYMGIRYQSKIIIIFPRRISTADGQESWEIRQIPGNMRVRETEGKQQEKTRRERI